MTLTRAHLFGFVGLVALAFALYWAKAEAQAVREQVIQLQDDVEAQRRQVRTLEAELAFIERPDRLEEAATAQLNLAPIGADRIATLDQLDQFAPLAGKTESPQSAPEETPESLAKKAPEPTKLSTESAR
jgi:cell division protein FtsL